MCLGKYAIYYPFIKILMKIDNDAKADVSFVNKNIFRLYLFIVLERGEGREKEREKHQCVVVSQVPPTGNLACNPGMCPDWELKW